MTCTLILMRHAKSDWGSAEQSDRLRPLNERGRRTAPKIGAWVRAQGVEPDVALVSDAVRTHETFQRSGFQCLYHLVPQMYLAPAEVLMEHLQTATDPTVLMIAHNPGIADFARLLVNVLPKHARFEDYPTCATTIIRWNVDGWNEIGWHKGQPIHFAIPADL